MSRTETDVLVVGAGVIGSTAARSLAPDHDVRVIERESIGAGASRLAGASTSSSRYVSDLPVMAGHVNQWFRDYDEAGRIDLTVSRDYEPVVPEEVEETRDRIAEMRTQGYPVAFVEREELAARCPLLDASAFGGAIRHDDYAWVDPGEYTAALARDARDHGATFQTGVTVTGLKTGDDGTVGVETDDGVLTADAVVVAAGWRTADLLSDVASLPMRPYITQGCEIAIDLKVTVEAFPTLRVPVESGTGAIYSEGGETLLVRPKDDGNLRVAGGHRTYDRDEYDYAAASDGTDAETEFIEFVHRTVPDLFPDVDEVTVVDDWAGTGGGLTPDTRPIIDTLDDGVVVATGFRAGFILSPIAAQAVRALVTGEHPPFALDPFRRGRF